MKKIIVFLLCVAAAGGLFAKGVADEVSVFGEKADLSYAFGMVIGGDLSQQGVSIDYKAFIEGLRAAMENEKTRFTMEEAMRLAQVSLQTAREKRDEAAQLAESLWLEENAQKEGISITESGLQYEMIREGDGPQPVMDDFVRVHYEGALITGEVFDSTYERGEPADFPLRAVIPGWSEAIKLMKTGGSGLFYIPSKLAYGPEGAGRGVVPPYATLVFKIELLEIIDQESFEWRYDEEEDSDSGEEPLDEEDF